MPQNTYEDESGPTAGVYEDVYLILLSMTCGSHLSASSSSSSHPLSPPSLLLPLAPPLSFSPARPTSEPGGVVEGNGGWTSDVGPPPFAAPTEPERGRGGQARPRAPQDRIRHGACRGRAATSTTSQVLGSDAPPRLPPTPALDAASCRSSWPLSSGTTSPAALRQGRRWVRRRSSTIVRPPPPLKPEAHGD
jgi:hypothetical protein